jgi:hypothetical protein
MSPAGGTTAEESDADAKSAAAVAVNPAADNFRKFRLVCGFDTSPPGTSRFLVSIVREYSSKV